MMSIMRKVSIIDSSLVPFVRRTMRNAWIRSKQHTNHTIL